MKIFLGVLLILLSLSCNEFKTNKSIDNSDTETDLIISGKILKNNLDYKIEFDSTKLSLFTIEDSEVFKTKALIRKLSDYSTKELEELPNFIRLSMSIIVPYDISKESLTNTLKSIVNEKIKINNDIDEIVIFVYDDKTDIGKIEYTFGKLLWSPYGKMGNVTSEIAQNNIRTNYEFDIIIKDKVGNISKSDIPTDRDIAIYKMIMDDKYIEMEEDKLNKMVMKKFNIKTEKELDEIWIKVAAYKN
jgi:hypothetical protein